MSPLLAPDIAEIERALDALLQKDRGARVLAMRSPMRRSWPDTLQRDGRLFRIAWCPSELEVRERLDEVEAGDEGVVVLTPLDSAALGDDVVARFPRARLEQTDRWSALRGAFRARDVDPRLRLQANRWLVELLLERPPVRGYAPAAGGVLDLESAWRAATDDVLSLPGGRTDAAALLDWSLDPAGLDRLGRLPEEARAAVVARLGAEGGPAAALVLAAAAAGRGADALPVALACGVVFGAEDPPPALREAAIRLEPMFGGTRVEPAAGMALAEAGRRILDRLAREVPAAARAVEARAAAILSDVRADGAAALSPALGIGLEARMVEAAAAIQRAVETAHADAAATAWDLAQHASGHDRAVENRARLDRLVMAARLARWLAARRASPWRSMAEAASAYTTEGGFVDWARRAIRGGDALPEVAAAYARLAEAVAARREDENSAFAEILREWTLRGGGDDPLPVEDLLAKVVAPLARELPVLLLVLDGLSFAVWRDLGETVGRLGWTELLPASRRSMLVAAAVLPSVTEVSRASLLCGTLTRGDQNVERAGFAAHAGLVAASRAGQPPRLFHKADLGAGPELGAEVRAAVADPTLRVVGVVHNAVDAQLSGSDQLDLTWSAEGLRQVAGLLQAARDAGRVVVVVGDHGHVLDEATTQLAGGSGDRWRALGVPPREGEVALSGGRVLSPAGGRSVVTVWSERVRFAAKRGGYHGGASPQEVLVPVAVLVAGQPPPGWSEAPPAEPAWWRGRTEEGSPWQAQGAAVPHIPARRRQAETRQAELFNATARPAAASPPRGPAWLDALLASDAYAAQRRLAGRAAPADEVLKALLEALAARGGRMTRTGLAQALGVAAFRLGGLVSAARRVLNLDQAQVLRDEGDDVVLDEALLCAQFGIGVGQ